MRRPRIGYLFFVLLFIQLTAFPFPKAFSEPEDSSADALDKVRNMGGLTDSGSTQKKAHRIAVGDKMKIKIYPEDEYVKGGDVEVSSGGTVTLNLIGKVPAEGMTVAELEERLTQILARDYLVDPVVVVEVDQSQSSKESLAILGQVQKPGTYDFPIEGHLTLLQLISKAGGFTPIANVKNIKIIRKEKGEKAKVIRANAEAIISGKQKDVELQPDDVIHVGESFF